MSGIDAHLLDVARDGRYWITAPRIDPATLVIVTRHERRPKPWAPSIYDDKLGVVAERPASVDRGGA